MSFSRTVDRPTPPQLGYSRLARVKDAFRFIRSMAVSRHVANTYGIETELVKRMKARFRNELSFGDGK